MVLKDAVVGFWEYDGSGVGSSVGFGVGEDVGSGLFGAEKEKNAVRMTYCSVHLGRSLVHEYTNFCLTW